MILFYICMTAYCTPYNALIPVLGKNQKDRMDISTDIALTYILGTGIAFGGKMIWEAVQRDRMGLLCMCQADTCSLGSYSSYLYATSGVSYQ